MEVIIKRSDGKFYNAKEKTFTTLGLATVYYSDRVYCVEWDLKESGVACSVVDAAPIFTEYCKTMTDRDVIDNGLQMTDEEITEAQRKRRK